MKLKIALLMVIMGVSVGISAEVESLQEQRIRQKYEKKVETILKELNLTEQQQSQIQAYKGSYVQKGKELYREDQRIRVQLQTARNEVPSLPGKIKGLTEALQIVDVKKQDFRFQFMRDMRKILNPEQYQRLNEIVNQELNRK